MQRRSGLGRGLGSLIPSELAAHRDGAQLVEIPIGSVVPNRFQPREQFDEETLVALTASIRELGVLQPILVRPTDDGYELVAGERRWRAARRAGLQYIPAIVRDVVDVASLEQAVVENLHRQDLNALEEAAAYQQLVDDFGLTHDQVATRVGRSRSAVANTLRLLQLPPDVHRMLIDGLLSAGHARALLALDDDDARMEMARAIVREGLSVRQTEARCRPDPEPGEAVADAPAPAPTSEGQAPRTTNREPALLELEGLLAERLATRVRIDLGSRQGRIAIDFADLDDLERIYRLLS